MARGLDSHPRVIDNWHSAGYERGVVAVGSLLVEMLQGGASCDEAIAGALRFTAGVMALHHTDTPAGFPDPGTGAGP